MSKERRQFSPQDKVKILREHLVDRRPISEICEKHQIQPTMFYNWQKTFFENGAVCGYGLIGGSSYKTTQFRQDAIIIWQGSETANSWNDGSNSPDEGFTQLHGDGGNMGGVDGHVQHISRLDFTRLSLSPSKNQLWCSPGSANGR